MTHSDRTTPYFLHQSDRFLSFSSSTYTDLFPYYRTDKQMALCTYLFLLIRMLPSNLVSVAVVLLWICSFSVGYDIIIYTATSSGIAAAITAARTSSSLSIAIIEPTAYVGGMVSAGGIGLRDCELYDVRELFN